MLAAVAFRTVGRQRHDAHPLREPWVAVAQMEPGVVADDDMHCLSIARGELFEIDLRPVRAALLRQASVSLAASSLR